MGVFDKVYRGTPRGSFGARTKLTEVSDTNLGGNKTTVYTQIST